MEIGGGGKGNENMDIYFVSWSALLAFMFHGLELDRSP
jgi:hypothetical protein